MAERDLLLFKTTPAEVAKYEGDLGFFKALEARVKYLVTAVERLAAKHGVPVKVHVHFTLEP